MKLIYNTIQEEFSKIAALERWQQLDTSARLLQLVSALGRMATLQTSFRWSDGFAERWNNLQIFRKKITGEDDRAYLRQKRLMELTRDIERTFFYGLRSEESHIPKTMGGLDYFLEEVSVPRFSSALDLDRIFQQIGRRLPTQTPYVFANPFTMSSILQLLQRNGARILRTGGEVASINIYQIPYVYTNTSLITEERSLNMVSDMWVQPEDMFVVTLDDLKYRYMLGRDMQLIENAITRNLDTEELLEFPEDILLCECSLEIHNLKNHFKFKFE